MKKIPILIILVFGICGCQTFKTYTIPFAALSDAKDKYECPYYKKVRTLEGKRACIILSHIDQRRDEISKFSTKKLDVFYDYSFLTIGMLAAGAAVADVHSSVLKGLTVGTAGLYGYKTYHAGVFRRNIYNEASGKLGCVAGTIDGYIFNEGAYFRLMKNNLLLRFVQAEFEALDLGSLGIQGGDEAASIKKLNDGLGIKAALDLSQEAINSYSRVPNVADVIVESIVKEMVGQELAARGDVNALLAKMNADTNDQFKLGELIKITAPKSVSSDIAENAKKLDDDLAGYVEDIQSGDVALSSMAKEYFNFTDPSKINQPGMNLKRVKALLYRTHLSLLEIKQDAPNISSVEAKLEKCKM